MVVTENKTKNIKSSVNINIEQSAESIKRSAKITFRWTSRIKDLLLCLNNFKRSVDYKGKDFDGDRAGQHAALRTDVAKIR